MHGRRLSTTDIVVVVTDGRSGETVEKVKEWCEKEGLEHRTVEVGEEVGEIPDEKQVLGVTAGGNGTFLEAVDALSPRGIPVLGRSLPRTCLGR
ncbi:MAG: hypothetical protein SV760_05540 [Halobacteria archaeon]|nr:hypothetical protein [Halobacteria archaeon]